MGFQLQFGAILGEWEIIASGALTTFLLSATAFVVGTSVAILFALVQIAGPMSVRLFVRSYVELIRNTPFLVQLFIIFFGLPSVGIYLSANQTAVLALVVNLVAYATEIVRAGIESIHRSQIEAGQSLALTRTQIFRYVVLLPALAKVWPALCGQFILLMLGSSLCSLITVEELSAAGAYIDARTFRSFEVYIVIAVAYLVLAMFFRVMLGLLGRVLFPSYAGAGRIEMAGVH